MVINQCKRPTVDSLIIGGVYQVPAIIAQLQLQRLQRGPHIWLANLLLTTATTLCCCCC